MAGGERGGCRFERILCAADGRTFSSSISWFCCHVPPSPLLRLNLRPGASTVDFHRAGRRGGILGKACHEQFATVILSWQTSGWGSPVQSRVGTMFGRYRLVRLVGEGGMGSVYEALDTDKGRTVALKILAEQYSSDDRFRERFKRESRAAATVQEPHVIPIHDWGEIDGNLYIDMRLVDGETLYSILKKRPLSPEKAVEIISQVAAALDAAHSQGLIHRDVKPQNIMVTNQGFVYLLDFGIAATVGETRLTMAGSQIGTFQYMAPERFSDADSGTAVDVYSLACVLYESLTGRPPFAAASLEGVMSAQMTAPPPRPSLESPAVNPAFDDVIARGMAKDPDDRYGSAGALARAAGKALRGETGLPSGPMPNLQGASAASWTGPLPSQNLQLAPLSQGGADSKRSWALPAVIAVLAALVLGGIGIVIGMLANQGPSSPTVNTSSPASAMVPATMPPAASPSRVSRPPLVTGPDSSKYRETCDEGFTVPDVSGWGSRAGRGTPETSCFFADSVLRAYWATYGSASKENREVIAAGAIPCQGGSSKCGPGGLYRMSCSVHGSEPWITCTGGNNAKVYLF